MQYYLNRHGLIALGIVFSAVASAASLKPETLKAWEEYVHAANGRLQDRLNPSVSFLYLDDEPDQLARVQNGEIVVFPASPHTPKKVSGGLIHHWLGDAFIPNARIDEVLPVVRDYAHYTEFYKPSVVRSKAISTSELQDRFSILLVNKPLVSKTALDSDYQSSYVRVSDHRWYSITQSTRIQEIAEYGTPDQHLLPEGEGSGLIWRVYSMARFEERDGGVFVELEGIALSREIPVSLKWMIEPIVRRVARSSLAASLKKTKDAVLSGEALAHHRPGGSTHSPVAPSFR